MTLTRVEPDAINSRPPTGMLCLLSSGSNLGSNASEILLSMTHISLNRPYSRGDHLTLSLLERCG